MIVTSDCSAATTVPFVLTVYDEQYIGTAYINLYGTVDCNIIKGRMYMSNGDPGYPDEEDYSKPYWNDFDFDNDKGEYQGFDLSSHKDVSEGVLSEIYDELVDLIDSSWSEITYDVDNFEVV